MNRKRVFVSSVQREFSSTRKTLVSLINNDPYWSKFFYAFIFENLSAVARSPEEVYLNEIDDCTIYLGIFGQQYGKMTSNGVSATEQKYNYATQLGKDRLIFVKNLPPRAKRGKAFSIGLRKGHQWGIRGIPINAVYGENCYGKFVNDVVINVFVKK